ncbi:M1 family peptidase, partial [Streptomyces rimosus]
MALSRSARRSARLLPLATAVAATFTLAAAPAAAPGAPGVGDPYFPNLGNGGFDALHYDLGGSYEPATG